MKEKRTVGRSRCFSFVNFPGEMKCRIWSVLRAVLLGVAFFTTFSKANFNLFLAKEEVKRILGLDAELFYVREGVVNDYAVGWSVKVPPQVHSLFFRWRALSKKPILYNVAVEASEEPSVISPSVNISLSGALPRRETTFRLDLPCTGKVSAEVEVILNLNVTSPSPSQPPTVVFLKRRKICLEGMTSVNFDSQQNMEEPPYEEEEGEDKALLLYGSSGVTSLAFVLAILVGVGVWKRKKSMRWNNSSSSYAKGNQNLLSSESCGKDSSSIRKCELRGSTSPEKGYTDTEISGNLTLPTSFTVNSCSSSIYNVPYEIQTKHSSIRHSCHWELPFRESSSGIYESSRYSSSESGGTNFSPGEDKDRFVQMEPTPSCECATRRELPQRRSVPKVEEILDQMQVERRRVRVTEVVQDGVRGKVYKGFVQREHPGLDKQVLVKTLRSERATEDAVSLLCYEGTKLVGLKHPNILTITGLCTLGNSPPLLIYPDSNASSMYNLKLYLKRRKRGLKAFEMIESCVQVARAVSFLHANHVTHADVAARNCLVSEKLELRLSDGALSRDLFPEDYEVLDHEIREPDAVEGHHPHLPLPLRWMSPELLRDARFHDPTSESDVWAMGMTFWEISTKGEAPYGDTPVENLTETIEGGHRPPQHPTCPDEVYNVMTSCWNSLSHRRPKAAEMSDFLFSFRSSSEEFV